MFFERFDTAVERSERRRTIKPIKTRELSDAQLWIPLSSFVYSIFDIGSEENCV